MVDWSRFTRNALLALGLVAFSAPPVEALEVVSGAQPAAAMNDGLLVHVRAVRHGGGRPVGAHRPVHRPGGVHRPPGGYRPPGAVHRPPGHRPGYRPPVRPGYRPPAHRPGYRPPVGRPAVIAPRAVWVGRPGWYRWAPGGAVAAGAAIGFLTAATVTWSNPPQPGLCWYYTDPSRTQGFWDACP